jgi:hypothetical protein
MPAATRRSTSGLEAEQERSNLAAPTKIKSPDRAGGDARDRIT